ncbi:hypothetical protein G6F46_002014 [Rhizopus delemar]|nr:hypothetical protein G6F43_002594 [Rhizopus delemar]KAG1538588.1 hypothetical protein G6F51_009681 [Rhizopus arrhizus]KAG1450042.1 hypothetical protein G6F55_009877 [Rhizopus delemar]KAG1492871.1 hypothetical protein G6F54_008989 [Rhizopus delemar]KAG1517145.1 hypothetical protein G6F53_001601 [Rhizopus delemar]
MDPDILNSITPSSIESPVIRTNNNRPERQRTLSIGPSLNSNANFYDIPASDAFNDLLERYVPPEDRPQRDINSDKSKSPEVMMMNNMWRSVAKYARQQIIQSDGSQVKHILQLWHMRLLALTKLGLYQLATAEFEKLGDLDRLELKDPATNESLVPFSLWILWARLPSYLKYPRLTLERLAMLAARCKKHKTDPIWAHREIQTYLVLVTHWIAIEDYSAAASTMELILSKSPDQVDILSGLGRLYLQMGDIDSANRMFERMREFMKEEDETVKINKAFTLMSKGEWHQARDLLQQVYESNNENLLVMNNLAACEVYLGNSIKAIEILETLTIKNPTSAGTCEVALMNLCTLYGLRYEDSTEKKVEVMKQVARWAGDSFQPECLKLQ